ncbi:NAD-dependent epimerase/dehydratase family protein [Halosolutus halophilus]|uniref:NAD-dependent epimerase/dehydratase family protein n=1 Tax=Halosolutus halophilus TaxID=1552990 RepID=UPI002234F6C3|nr:NAD-dependent epimerase/dehydratase family protein [Halosolutus halophilus]
MNVLVTGGAGFIGSHVAERLLDRGHHVVTLDVLDSYYDRSIKRRNLRICRETGGDRFEFVEGSITDERTVRDVISSRDVDVIYHKAAQAGVRTSVENPHKPHEINTTGLLTVLQAADEHGVDRLINASSSSVYGDADTLPYVEDARTRPRSPYAVTKRTGEHYCRVWNDVYDVPTVSLRYFTVYGPRMRPNMAITNFTSRCLNGKPMQIYGDGRQSRDFTHVADVVDANVALLETDAADGEVLNVGSTGNITIVELAEHVAEATGGEFELEYTEPKAADARHTHADVSKARNLIGYEPSISIRDGVSAFVDWYRQNRDWYEPLVVQS